MTQTNTISTREIRQLRIAAGEAGDLEQVAICDVAWRWRVFAWSASGSHSWPRWE
jgi:hypothetical protein